MCGICGTYGFSDRMLLQRMCDAMIHRGPDDEGMYVGDEAGLGMRRLSVIDVEGGHQPIHNEDESIWIVFNGEVYNFLDLRRTLESKGHRFYTRSDTEVVVHAYEEYGDGFVRHLRGMFSFALWDSARGRLILVRDRIGIKPLYYQWENQRLWFASEIKCLLQAGASRELDFLALHQYLSFAHIPAPLTIFKRIKKLLPGHMLIFSDGQMEMRPYWDLNTGACLDGISREEAKREVLRLIEEAVRTHLVADVPLGAFLSGGVDSSAIVAIMAGYSSQPVRTFSLAFESRARHFDETNYARLVSKQFRTEHTEIPVTVDVVKLLPEVIRHFDEPFANDTALVLYQLSKEVRKYVTVALSGTGGDEVFAGYNRYIGMQLADLYTKAPRFLRAALADLISRTVSERVDGRHFPRWLREFSAAGLMGPEDRYVSWCTYFSEDTKRELYSKDMSILMNGTDGASVLRRYLQPAPWQRDYTDTVFYGDIKTYLPYDQLEYSEKMSMAHSLELRVPFCDHVLVEFSARLPLSMKSRSFRPKQLLKEALQGIVPKPILDRPKLGLHAPVGIWLQSDLKPLIAELLSKDRMKRRGYFRHNAVQEMIHLHLHGRRDFSWQIWMLLIFELWHQIYIDYGNG